jgi:FixJ family two-component response regulator
MNVLDFTLPRENRCAQNMTPVVFVLDDDVSVREALESLILSAGWKPEPFASAVDFLSRPRTHAPSCLLLDANLPGISGLDVLRLVADRVEMPVIFISGLADVPMTVKAMKAGAVEFLTKPLPADMVLSTVREAIERSRAALEHRAAMRALEDRYATLSQREREVMKLVTAGLLNKQVGAELGISEVTVKAHRGKMMRKMQVASLVQLVSLVGKLQFTRRELRIN